MEESVMKVIATLQAKYGWTVEPSVTRMNRIYLNHGLEDYVAGGLSSYWSSLIDDSTLYIDDNNEIGLPVIAEENRYRSRSMSSTRPKLSKEECREKAAQELAEAERREEEEEEDVDEGRDDDEEGGEEQSSSSRLELMGPLMSPK